MNREDTEYRKDIIRMAEEAGAIHYWHLSNLERFAALVASAERERLTDAAMKSAEKAVEVAMALEREACAKVCAEDGVQAMDFTGGTFVGGYFAKKIISRGEQ